MSCSSNETGKEIKRVCGYSSSLLIYFFLISTKVTGFSSEKRNYPTFFIIKFVEIAHEINILL